ncbi:MAG: molybdenum cofactor guanylyltransferase [Rhodobacterales bacterium]|nr:MAG: molybdenum cofactor guanylyltransferase [Rhodobacterales bacterium]
MSNQTALVAVVIAGGQSRRMGRDKAGVALGAQPMLAHVVERLSPQVARVAVNAPVAVENVETIRSEHALGPLSGVLAAMRWAEALGEARVLTTPVDVPFFPADMAARLAACDAPVVMAESASGLHPVSAVWQVSQAEALAQFLAAGERKLRVFAAQIGGERVRFDGDPDPFFNVNTPEELASAQKRLKKTPPSPGPAA